MKSKFFLQLIICLAFSGGLPVAASAAPEASSARPARAASSAPAAVAVPVAPDVPTVRPDQTGRELLHTFRDPDISRRFAALDRLFLENIDLDYVARFVMGKYWRTMSDEQKKTYLQLFRRYALSSYKTFPLDFVNSLSYQVTGAAADKQFTTVSAVVHVRMSPDQPAEDFVLYFRLHETGGKIKLVDIKLAESSLILAYRNKFYQQIADLDGEIAWFLEDLETQTVSNENNNRRKLELSELRS